MRRDALRVFLWLVVLMVLTAHVAEAIRNRPGLRRPRLASASSDPIVDYTDSICTGAWLLFDNGAGQSAAEADRATHDGADDLTFFSDGGSWSQHNQKPQGTNSSHRSSVFTGSDDEHFFLAHDAKFEPGDSFSFMMWVRADNNTLFHWMSKEITNWAGSRLIGGVLRGHAENATETSTESLAIGTWKHLGVSVTTSDVQTIVNGVETCNGQCESHVIAGTLGEQLVIGAKHDGTDTLGGKGYEAAFCPVILTDQQWCEIMLCGLQGDAASPTTRDTNYGSASCSCATINTCC